YGLNEEYGEVTPYTNDGGIDGIIFEDELGLSQIHIQAKQHTNPIGQKDLKEFAYTLEHGIQKGVMITTSSFTKGAIEISKESDAQIVLIDGKRLTQLMIKHDVGVFTEYNYSIKKIDSDFFEDE
ncbi:MAG: restriction endonuclease, partial [Methanobrevibacter sp.]|nr:restriction endonuclease [Methanobrevibacter sp.]